MLTFPNLLSLMRGPLALVFLQDNPFLRTSAIIIAMLTDFLDGYISRYYRMSSRIGTMLDPLMDKLFVLSVMIVFFSENKLNMMEATAMFCRDISVLIFGSYLLIKGNFFTYEYRSIWCGKITTTFQFIVLLCLTNNITFPTQIYGLFFVLGLLALVELYLAETGHASFSGSD